MLGRISKSCYLNCADFLSRIAGWTYEESNFIMAGEKYVLRS